MSESIIEHVYRVGYVTREKERDYDPLSSAVVCDAIEKIERFEKLAEMISDGNFNQKDVISEARRLLNN